MAKSGLRNLITDVDGISVGNAEDIDARTGVTVIVPDDAAIAAADIRGGAPGTRETETLGGDSLVKRVNAVVLSGGSAFGLDAASGVAAWLKTQNRGFFVGDIPVPIVPAAVLFDLLNGGEKEWGEYSPYRDLGRKAIAAASETFQLGNVGAGLGATAGSLKGGLGSASLIMDGGYQIGAVVAVNSVGSVVMPGTNTFWAWATERDGEFGGNGPPTSVPDLSVTGAKPSPMAAGNTTIGVVATNAALDGGQTKRMAIMAQDGIARAVRPAHTPFDGDAVFALATGRAPLPDVSDGDIAIPAAVAGIGAAAADCMERAIARAVYAAQALGDIPAYRDLTS
jgi:L-aminopeptidase/D-esterase-like protein